MKGLRDNFLCKGVVILLWMMAVPAFSGDHDPIAFDADAAWTLHDIQKHPHGVFMMTGPDPYWISPMVHIPIHSVHGFFGDLQIESCSGPLMIQLFWDTDSTAYSEIGSYRFPGNPDPSGTMAFWLPFDSEWLKRASMQSSRIRTLRMDIESSHPCMVRIRQLGIARSPRPDLAAWIPAEIRYPVLERDIPSDVSEFGQWQPHDLEFDDDGFWRVIGEDPFWVSPVLNLSLRRVKAIAVEMRFSHIGSRKSVPFQVFWKTYGFDFDEKRSFRFRVAPREGGVRYVLPLETLPQEELLQHIRIDLDGCPECHARIVSMKFLSGEIGSYVDQVPRQITYALGRNIYGRRLLEDIWANLRRDPGFLLFYFACLVGCLGMLYRLRKWNG